MALQTTYSFKDLVAVFSHPVVGSFTIKGQIGAGNINIANTTERTTHDVANDGAVMPSYVAGDNATCTIECQQTSTLHKFLLAWANTVKTLADQDDVSEWATASLHIRTIADGSVHNLIGISPSKIPDKSYSQQGQKITWSLMVCNAQQQ